MRPPLLVPLAILVALNAAAGCLRDSPDSDSAASTTPSFPPFPEPTPNFIGNWSVVPGNFSLFRIHTEIERFNATTNAPDPYSACSPVPFGYNWDPENATLELPKIRPFHPIDPGPLRVMYLNELRLKPQTCTWSGAYGINENATSPPLCVWGLPKEVAEARSPWRCHLPIEPVNSRNALVWLNVSFTLDASKPGGFVVVANDHATNGNSSTSFHVMVEPPGGPHRFEVDVRMESLGLWPYGTVVRT